MTVTSFGGSGKQYCTPEPLLEPVYAFGRISLDPCSHPDSIVKAKSHIILPENARLADQESPGWLTRMLQRCGGIVRQGDGLKLAWARDGLNFVNPPFHDVLAFIEKAMEQAEIGCEAVLLLNNDTSTSWYQDVLHPNAAALCLFRGRKKYIGAKYTNPFPHLFAYFGWNADGFCDVFRNYGRCV